MIDLSFISIPLVCLLVIYAVMWPFYTLVAALFPTPKVKRGDSNPLISIVVPANNEEKVIGRSIRNFARQTYKKLELIIVCHNCTDDTYPIAKKVAESVSGIKVKVIDCKTRESGKGLALNRGLKEATGELLSYFDADGTTNDTFFERVLKYIDSGYDCVQSKIVAKNPNDNLWTKIQGYEMLVFAMVFCEGRYKLGLNSGIGGTGVVVKTEIMRTIGGFGNSLVDDLDICMELTKRGYRIAFARDCVVYDEKPLTWSGAFKQRTRWFRGHFDVLFSRFQETIKRPHDLLYLLSPTVVIALWTSLALGVLYIIQIHIFKTVFITYYGITLKTLAILTTPYVIQFFIGAAKEEGKLRALKNTVLYVFPLYLWTFIWYLVMFKAISVKSWETTKTLHIGDGGGR
ncbi:Glycosyltransferase AglE [ANME-1 cluster archaeon GoMg1]|nr:Glycosyltransferase AglE [ANME-1 cluster archaeon GoMg1]